MIGLQRARLLSAAVGVLAEQGCAKFTAAAVCGRAGVSRRTFYQVFENREACFAAILRGAEQHASGLIAGLDLDGRAWGERVRLGLWAILCLAEQDPALARVCLVESQRAGTEIQAERERIISRVVDALDEGRSRGGGSLAASRLTGEALVGAVTSVIASRLAPPGPARSHAKGRPGGGISLRGLLGELVGMIVLPYEGPAAARRQVRRALPEIPVLAPASSLGVADPLAGLPMRLTYRTARVLQAVAELAEAGPGASNRRIADHAEVKDAGQTSKLLSRLQEHGLLENAATDSHARGEANQWRLTRAGMRVMQSIGQGAETSRSRSASVSAGIEPREVARAHRTASQHTQEQRERTA